MQSDRKPGICNRVEGTSRCERRKTLGRCTEEDLLACGKKNKEVLLLGTRYSHKPEIFSAAQAG